MDTQSHLDIFSARFSGGYFETMCGLGKIQKHSVRKKTAFRHRVN